MVDELQTENKLLRETIRQLEIENDWLHSRQRVVLENFEGEPQPRNGAQQKREGQEINQSGVVQFETYMDYLRSMGGLWVGVAMLVLFSVTQASVLVTIATVGRWAERPSDEQVSQGSSS